ncbi:MAG: RimK-like ATPgrasp N-terminal domain-containing protein [Nitrososphaerales archaeon]
MLVVSNIDLRTDLPHTEPLDFLKSFTKDFVLNLSNDYRYMKLGYYVSLHAETLGDKVLPSTEDCVDAYRVPVLLLRASKNGVPTTPFLVADSVSQILAEFDLPVVLFPINPFSFRSLVVARSRDALYKAFRSMSLNHRFAVCAQPFYSEIISCKSFFGRCASTYPRLDEVSQKVFQIFKIPICKLLMQRFDGHAYLCALQPLSLKEILSSDVDRLSRALSLLSRKGFS